MYINNDFLEKGIQVFNCDGEKEESQLKSKDTFKKLLKSITTLGTNTLYNRHGANYKETIDIPSFLFTFRLCSKGIMPKLDERFPTLEDIYKLMEDEDYTESEINNFKNLPNSWTKEAKDSVEVLVKEGTASYDLDCKNWCKWMGDKTIDAPLDAVTFWNDYTVTNTWKLSHNDESQDGGDIYEDKTEEEIKEIVSTIAKNFFGDVLESTNTIPVDFDEKGGIIFNKTSLSDGDDEDTYIVTDGYGDEHIVDGKEKATEKATELVNEKIQIQFGIRIERKITEPDGYFAWREENIADYL